MVKLKIAIHAGGQHAHILTPQIIIEYIFENSIIVQSGNLEKETSDTSDFNGLLICYFAPLTLSIHIFSSASEFVQGKF